MTKSRERYLLGTKFKAIATLLSYAIQQERCEETNGFDAILRYVKMCSREDRFSAFTFFLETLEVFVHASPRAVILITAHLGWCWRIIPLAEAQDLISKWVSAISAAPHTEEVAQSAVDTLLQIAANPNLRPSIPADAWLCLNRRPSLPPACRGPLWGSGHDIVQAVRGLNDTGIHTSYLILVWSEWNPLDYNSFAEMGISAREDFNGIRMSCHRAELIQRLDHILGELDRRSRHLDVNFEDGESWCEKVGPSLRVVKDRYGQLRRILQEVDEKAPEILNGMPHSFKIFLCLLTLMDLHRIPIYVHVCNASPMPITSHLERSVLRETSRFVHSHFISSLFPCALLVDLE